MASVSAAAPGLGTGKAVLLVLAGSLAFSSAGLFVRVLGKDIATTLFWRGIFTALVVALFIAWREGPRTWASFRAIGWPGVWITLLNAASTGTFIASLNYTTVANNSIIFGTSPFMTAGLAWLVIRERPGPATLGFAALALVGALLVVGSSVQVSADGLLGDALAVLMTLAFAVKVVLVRKHGSVSMVPTGCLAALLCAACAIPFVTEWAMSARDLALFATFGFTQQGLGLILTTIGMAYLPSAHTALLMLLDLPLAPAWVWLVVGERPAPLALAGGAIVLTAVIGHILVTSRRAGG